MGKPTADLATTANDAVAAGQAALQQWPLILIPEEQQTLVLSAIRRSIVRKHIQTVRSDGSTDQIDEEGRPRKRRALDGGKSSHSDENFDNAEEDEEDNEAAVSHVHFTYSSSLHCDGEELLNQWLGPVDKPTTTPLRETPTVDEQGRPACPHCPGKHSTLQDNVNRHLGTLHHIEPFRKCS